VNCEDLKPVYPLYALGVAEEPERTELAAHLARQCPVCKPGVEEAMRMVSAFSAVAPLKEPPKRLRRRVVLLAQPDRAYGWLSWALGAVSLCLGVGVAWFGIQDYQQERAISSLQARLERSAGRAERLEQTLEFLREPETREVTFGASGERQPPRGRVFVNATRGVLLLASNLPPLPGDRTYQFWLIPKGANPLPAGLFRSDAEGEALHLISQQVDLSRIAAVAVSVEPASGSPQPTTTPILVVTL